MRYWDSALSASESLLDRWLLPQMEGATQIALRTGFLSVTGARVVAPHLRACLAAGGRVTVVAGGDDLQVDPLAVEILHATLGDHERGDFYLLGDATFTNAKTYFMRHSDGHVAAYVGSANLTGGMVANIEAGCTLDSSEDEQERAHCEEVLAGIMACTRKVDAGLVTGQEVDRRLILGSVTYRARYGRGRTKRVSDALMPVMDRLDAIASHRSGARASRAPFILTGLTALDEEWGGFAPGTFTVIGGEASSGKTALVVSMIRHMSISGHRVLAFANDDPDRDHTTFMTRLVSAWTSIAQADMHGGLMTDEDWTRLATAATAIAELPMTVNGRPGLAVGDLVEEVTDQVLYAQPELRPDIVLIDGIATMTCSDASGSNRERETAEIALALKTLAHDLGIPVVVTSPLNRGPLQRPGRRPELDDLRDSGALAQHAHSVLLVHRLDELTTLRGGELDIICAKQPHGRPFTATFALRSYCSRVNNIFVRPVEIDGNADKAEHAPADAGDCRAIEAAGA